MAVKILVVDDEPDLELLLRQKFRKRMRTGDWHFVFASDGLEALAKFEADPELEVVLTDINMPRMDGLTLLGKLCEQQRLCKAVVVSAYGDMKNIRTAMNRGAFDFITKPIDFADLEATIHKTVDEIRAFKKALEAEPRLHALQRELEMAQRIQEAVFMSEYPTHECIDLQAFMVPANEVGGDFYDCFFVDEDHLGLVIGDVSGKGISAAMFMAVSRTLLRGTALHSSSAAECMNSMNRLLYPQSLPHMFVTVFYGILDLRSGKLDYCNAGHHAPLLLRDHEAVPLPHSKNLAVALVRDHVFEAASVTLQYGDHLLLFTDGVVEAADAEGGQFGEQRLIDAVKASTPNSAAELVQQILHEVTAFSEGAPQSDDITLLSLAYCDPDLPRRSDSAAVSAMRRLEASG